MHALLTTDIMETLLSSEDAESTEERPENMQRSGDMLISRLYVLRGYLLHLLLFARWVTLGEGGNIGDEVAELFVGETAGMLVHFFAVLVIRVVAAHAVAKFN